VAQCGVVILTWPATNPDIGGGLEIKERLIPCRAWHATTKGASHFMAGTTKCATRTTPTSYAHYRCT